MNLAGAWSFALDPADVGVDARWFAGPLRDQIALPGSLQEQGYGDDISVDTAWTGSIQDRRWFTAPEYARYRTPGQVKLPFWLQPVRHYCGAAWYQRTISIPPEWHGRRVTLWLERVHWSSRAWIDGRELTAWRGTNASLSVPHVYELDAGTTGDVTLTLRIDNRLLVDVGPNAHSVSDHTQTNWNGVVGGIELRAGAWLWLDDVQCFPDSAARAVDVELCLGGAASAHPITLMLQARAPGAPAPAPLHIDLPAGTTRTRVRYGLGAAAPLWDEFSPVLHTLEIRLAAGDAHDVCTTTFGLRDVRARHSQITINDRPIFLRGTLECAIFPHTGYPPTDVAEWRRLFGIVQAHGLNHVRFHSWCPPDAAFTAADQLGVYLQVECAAWANQGATVGDGRPLDAWLYDEGHRIIAAYGNHPSFILMTYGNEPAGAHHREYLVAWVRYWKHHEPRRLHTSGAGWPAIPENDYHNIPEPRVQRWGEELRSRINALPPETLSDYREYVTRLAKPIISHEIGQWCVFPDLDEIGQYTGVLRARNMEIVRDTLAANHMGDQAHDFLLASGALQTLCYKEDIESALRTPGFAGFQLLDLHDFPGQGTALVGVLNAFWGQKGYVTPAQFRRFCDATVPLARLARRWWCSDEPIAAEIDVAHYGPTALPAAAARWWLRDAAGQPLAGGTLHPCDIPSGAVTRLGTVVVAPLACRTACKVTLVVEVGAATNDWDLWLFPRVVDAAPPAGVLVTDDVAQAEAQLAEGGRVLLLPDPQRVRVTAELGFSSVFWNTAWTVRDTGDGAGQAPHTLGLLCDPAHPALAAFPTERHSNWHWWEIVHGAAAMTLDHLPPALRPIVQPIDTWFENRRLALVFEARVGAGRLIVCSADLAHALDQRVVARQLRHSLLAYLASDACQPAAAIDVAALRALFV
ncbi:MAG: glycoside hydrolase [Chloroflexi bacterium]|nr:glycoside hydrolase [Chloroflexota bacterium]